MVGLGFGLGFSKGGGGFEPTSIDDLVLWIDPSDESTITASGSDITSIADKSGNGNDATASGTEPTTGTATINGKNAISFGASSGRLGISDSADFNHTTGTDGITAFIVVKDTSVINSYKPFLTKVGASGQREWGIGHLDTTNGKLLATYPTTGTSYSGLDRNNVSANNDIVIYGMQYDSVNDVIKQLYNRTVAQTQFNSHVMVEGSTDIYIANDAGTNYAVNTDIGEVMIYNRALTDAEIDKVGAYLATKWGGTWATVGKTAIITNAGQSNATNAFANGTFYGEVYADDGEDAFVSTLGTYYDDIEFLNNAESGAPVMEDAGSGSNHWIDTDLTDGPILTQWKSQLSGVVEGFGTYGDPSKAIATVWIGSEGDSGEAEAGFETAIEQLYSEFRDYTDTDHKVFVVLPGRRDASFDDTMQRQRNAILDAINDLSYVEFGADAFDIPLADSQHYTPAGQATLHTRLANRVAAVMGKRSEVGTLGPVITAAEYNGDTVTATFTKDGGSDLSGSEVDQFRIEDDGTPVTISSLSIDNSANTITFTLSAEIAPTSTVQLWANYGRGADTTTANLVRDANGLPLRSVKELSVADESVLTEVDVFIIAGQSNGVGQETTDPGTYTDAFAGSQIWSASDTLVDLTIANAEGNTSGEFGPEIAASRYYKTQTGGDNIFIKTAVNATNLEVDWKPTATFGTRLSNAFAQIDGMITDLAVDEGIQANIVGVFWIQGESDTHNINPASYADNYEQNLTDLIAAFRTKYGAGLKFAINQLWPSLRTDIFLSARQDIVRAAQAAVTTADANAFLTLTGNLTAADQTHYDGGSANKLGEAMMASIIDGENKTASAPGADNVVNGADNVVNGSDNVINS